MRATLRKVCAVAVLIVPAVGAPTVDVRAQTRFLVAGHTYGTHQGDNQALWPPFLAALQRADLDGAACLVLAGDFVRHCDAAARSLLQQQIEQLPVPVYLLLGNHEETTPLCREWVVRRHGGAYYTFGHGDLFGIVLDSQQHERAVAAEQVSFLAAALARAPAEAIVCVFMHELLWLAEGRRYAWVRANRRSRQEALAALPHTNYWRDVHPLLVACAPRPIYVIAGDVGGNPDAVPAFFDVRDNVTLVATGMGGAVQDNYLEVELEDGRASFRLVPLDPKDAPLPPLTHYTAEWASSVDGRGRTLGRRVRFGRWAWMNWPLLAGGLVLIALAALTWKYRARLPFITSR